MAGSSVSAFVSALILYGLIALIFFTVFLVARNKYLRVYEPRHVVETLPEKLRTDSPPKKSSWISFLLSKPQSFVIEKAGVDGYFFLRYLTIFATLGAIGGLFIWPVLFAVNATGGGGSSGFDIISYSNVNGKWRTFAHVFCSWLFFGLVIYTIYKELIYYTSFRHALETTPYYSSLLSSRTLLIDNVPSKYLDDEQNLSNLFPKGINFWFTRDTKDLQKLNKKRTKLGGKLEAGINKVITKSMKLRNKAIKKNKPLPEPANELVSYIPEKKLPTYKDKPIIGKKKKLFSEGIDEFHEYNVEIKENQAKYPQGFEKTGSVFIEFASAYDFHQTYQMIPYIKDLKNSRRHIAMSPEDVVWENSGTNVKSRSVKKIIAVSVLTWLVIFWAIPVAVVGAISNINMLTNKVHFLRFINNLPSVLMGLITSLLPTILLAVLMQLLPRFIRKMGKFSGLMTVQEVERWTQQWYFAFQVIQVFLVTTLASSAASTATQIVENPSSAMQLLGKYLPPASNFYISYLLLQGLSISSGALAQLVPLILSLFLGKILDKTPRKKWTRANTIGSPSWGTTYPVYGMFTVIMLCYSIIAPIIIAFTLVSYLLIFLAFLYNLNYVFVPTFDSRGRGYPLALFQVFVGLYLAELCLIALFVMPKNWACVALEVVMLVATVLAHLYFRYKFEPVLDTVPLEAINGSSEYPMNDQGWKSVKEHGKSLASENFATTGVAPITVSTMSPDQFQDEEESTSVSESRNDAIGSPTIGGTTTNTNNPFNQNGKDSILSDPAETTAESRTNEKFDDDSSRLYDNSTTNNHTTTNGTNVNDPFESEIKNEANVGGYDNNPEKLPTNPKDVGGYVKRYFAPRKFLTYNYIKSLLPHSYNEQVHYPTGMSELSYNDPASVEEEPHLWIPKDSQGLSQWFIENGDEKVLISDENAVVSDEGKVEYLGNPPDYTPDVKM